MIIDNTQKRPKRRKATNRFTSSIKKLVAVHEGVRVSTQSLGVLDGMTVLLATKIALHAHNLTVQAGRSTVTEKAVKTAIRSSVPKGLATLAMEAVDTAITQFEKSSSSKKQFSRREMAAGILVSVSVSEKFLRLGESSSLSIAKMAPIGIAAGLEAILTTVISQLVDHINEVNAKTISVKTIVAVFHADADLKSIVDENRIVILRGGVVPFIDQRLTEIPADVKQKRASQRKKSALKRKKEGVSQGTRRHKHLPGKKAITLVKKYQKSTKTILQVEPFKRFLRDVTAEFGGKTKRFSEGSALTLQYYIEHIIINLFRVAQDISLNSNKHGVYMEQLQTAVSRLQLPAHEPDTSVEFVLKSNGILNLSHKGGVIRLGGDSYKFISDLVVAIAVAVMRNVVDHIEYFNVVTISKVHMARAIASATGDNVL